MLGIITVMHSFDGRFRPRNRLQATAPCRRRKLVREMSDKLAERMANSGGVGDYHALSHWLLQSR